MLRSTDPAADRTVFCRATVQILLLLAGSAMILGCGSAEYEKRLKAADDYYRFLGRQNDYLDSPWVDPATGIEIRAPKPFKPLPAPAPPAEGDPAPARDTRQPDYLEVELPGLVGAWQGRVEAEVAGQTQSVPVYFYLLSNSRQLQQTGATDEATLFSDNLLDLLCKALEIERPADGQWAHESFPRTSSYLEPKEYHSIRLESSKPINDAATDFYIYEHQNGDVRVTLLFVIPQQMASSESLQAGRTVALETLSVPAQAPQSTPAAEGGGRPAPRRSSGGF